MQSPFEGGYKYIDFGRNKSGKKFIALEIRIYSPNICAGKGHTFAAFESNCRRGYLAEAEEGRYDAAGWPLDRAYGFRAAIG